MPYRERNLEHDRAGIQDVLRLTGQTGVPVIVSEEPGRAPEVIIGFDRPRLEQLAARSRPAEPPPAGERVRLGLRVTDGSGGALVDAVRADSPAERGGVQIGDIIEAVGGHPVRSGADLEAAAARLTAGQAVAVDLRRGTRRVRLRLPT